MTDQELDDLEARLHEEGLGFGIGPALLCQQAADAIAELREKNAGLVAALEGMLRHSCVADAHPEDKDGEDHAAESAARKAIEENTQ